MYIVSKQKDLTLTTVCVRAGGLKSLLDSGGNRTHDPGLQKISLAPHGQRKHFSASKLAILCFPKFHLTGLVGLCLWMISVAVWAGNSI